MRTRNTTNNKYLRRSVWSGLLFILVAAVTLEATALIQYVFSKKGLRTEAERRAESELTIARQSIENITSNVETAVKNVSWAVGMILADPDSLFTPLEKMLETNPLIMDGALAFIEDYYPSKGQMYEPLIARRENGVLDSMVLGSETHDYLQKDWFLRPIATGKPYWSEPYFDESGGKTTVVTLSAPLLDPSGVTVGVVAADIALEWLDLLLEDIELYIDSYSTLVTRNGTQLAGPSEIPDVEKPIEFTSKVKNTGWVLSATIPEASIFKDINRIIKWVTLFQLLGLLMLILILRSSARNQIRLSEVKEKKEKMESELKIAHGIQMAMIPNTFPPFPERSDIDVYAFLDPAKEVGGDLYDFYIREDKLFFCIGDVSGKGVPASLVMATTRTLFRTVSAHETSPLHIVTTMNDSMADSNEDTMFVTFFCGILDLLNGHLRYCNAGHNAPLLISDTVRPLPVVPNLPLGVLSGMAYKEQETDLKYGDYIFLYTDGVTEAENKDHRLFGEENMTEVLRKNRGKATDNLNALKKTISGFVGDAVQSDDMTTVLIRYMNDKNPDASERHLILHNDIQQIPQLAGFVKSIAEEKHLDQSQAMYLNLALEEAVTNVIMYAYPKGADGLVDIEAIIRKDSIDFLVIDSGKPFDPTAVPMADTELPLESRPIGGLGIFLVKKIMTSVHYERKDGKNILSMTKII